MPNKKGKTISPQRHAKKPGNKNRTSENRDEGKKRRHTSIDQNQKSAEKEVKKRNTTVDLSKQSIPINSAIETATNCYFVLGKLGSGGFGDVYKVMRSSDKQIFAVKVEYVKTCPERRLKKEYELYREITKLKRRGNANAEHLMGVIDYGECPELVHFMFMPLCGQSLESILKDRMPTFETALILSEQTLRAVQNFHTFMHIHRDLKPANFVFGQVPWHNKIFLIDFGMAVRFCVDPKKMPKTSVYDFIGTLRYAPRNMHKGMPQGRKDDLESWLYVVFELYKREILPWSHERDTKRVEFQKERMFIEMPESIFEELPSCFMKIAREINKLSIFEQPKYDSIHAAFYKLANEMKVRFNDPLEFVGGVDKAPKSGKKQASLIQIVNPVPFAPPTLSLVEAKTIYATRTMEGVEETSRRVSKPAKSITVVKEAFGGQANKSTYL